MVSRGTCEHMMLPDVPLHEQSQKGYSGLSEGAEGRYVRA